MNNSIINIEDFKINNKICITLSNNINFNKINIDILKKQFTQEMNQIVTNYNLCNEDLIIIVDYNKIDFNNISIVRAKTIIKLMMNLYPNMLHRCIFYNTNSSFNSFIKLIKVFFDKITANKIVVKKEISDIINELKNPIETTNNS